MTRAYRERLPRRRDMTEARFRAELRARGWEESGVLGYVHLGGGLHASRWNGGDRRRDQLAYLERACERLSQKVEP